MRPGLMWFWRSWQSSPPAPCRWGSLEWRCGSGPGLAGPPSCPGTGLWTLPSPGRRSGWRPPDCRPDTTGSCSRGRPPPAPSSGWRPRAGPVWAWPGSQPSTAGTRAGPGTCRPSVSGSRSGRDLAGTCPRSPGWSRSRGCWSSSSGPSPGTSRWRCWCRSGRPSASDTSTGAPPCWSPDPGRACRWGESGGPCSSPSGGGNSRAGSTLGTQIRADYLSIIVLKWSSVLDWK